MPDELVSFQDAIEATEGRNRGLLIGNGFSIDYFSYHNLLEAAGLAEGSPIKRLFDALDTVDFEAVIRALDDAIVVEQAYGNQDHADELEHDAQAVREALVKAVNATHPTHRDELTFKYASADAFIGHFGTIFTLNYDLLLYWVNLHSKRLNDGFGLGQEIENGRFRGPFNQRSYCDIFNLHGGLHLFQNRQDEVFKAQHTDEGMIATISRKIVGEKRLPLYVAEGSSVAKARKIFASPYLRHCFGKLREQTGHIFVFGHRADNNDAHIYHAIFGNENIECVWFGIYRPDPANIREADAKLSRFSKLEGSKVSYKFFDAETARVWDGPPEE
ncbi:DUF4917 family protein [Tropicibacter alexandrii]|uniref:DUF4917 family protein n=1 Tax=Tropicibacter alexandrii TaxID=2267683 RepID=UPI000EF54F0D|nr:DUF4917 family protein [Tropicibacter alexandrii]